MAIATIERPVPQPDVLAPQSGVLAPTPARAALHDLLGMAPGMLAFGAALGISARALGTEGIATVLGGPVMYAGGAQLTAMTMLHAGASLAAVVAAAAVVNARLMLYGAVLEPWFRRQPLWFRLLGAHCLVDQTFLATTARTDLDDPIRFRRYWSALGLGLLAVWCSAVTFGVLAGPLLPPLPHLALVGLALFVAMLVPRLTSRPALAAAAAGAATAPLVALVAPGAAMLAGSAVGVLAGAMVERRRAS